MSNMLYDDEERRRLLERLLGRGRSRGRGEFEGRGFGRAQRGRAGMGLGLAALMGSQGQRRSGLGRGGLGQSWHAQLPNPSDFRPPSPPPGGPPFGEESAFDSGYGLDTGTYSLNPAYPHIDPGEQTLNIPPWLRDLFPPKPPGGGMRRD